MSPRVAPLPPSILSGVQLSAPHWFRVAGKGAQVRRSGAALGVEAGGAGGCNSWQQRGCLGSVVPSTASQKLQPELSRAPGHLWHGSFALEALLWTLRGKAGPWGSQAWPPLEGLEGVEGMGWRQHPPLWCWDGKSVLRQQRAHSVLPSVPRTPVRVGDMPTASWIKKMSSNWILPFLFPVFIDSDSYGVD